MQHTLPIIVVNGVIDAQVSPLDRGFTYGDGVFETCKMIESTIPLWNFHCERLLHSCKKLSIAVDVDVIEAQLKNLISEVDSEDKKSAIIKIIVTRGQGGRGYNISNLGSPTMVIGIFPATPYPEAHFSKGVKVRLCNQRLGCNSSLAGLKHLNRLEQILARAEWQDETIAEGIVLDVNENLIEAVFSNIFLAKNGELITPDLSEAGVAGVMRRFIIENLAPQAGLHTHIKKCALNDLVNADEVFLCNSNYGIWPVTELLTGQSYRFPVGEITRRLQKLLPSQ
ncbi:MAG: aminodeoxychorismate lyase [Gammaproteobacteria bacterium]|nr:MAG: aminodeoxychorismate lyase [Gammaproteobacteria bacterium]